MHHREASSSGGCSAVPTWVSWSASTLNLCAGSPSWANSDLFRLHQSPPMCRYRTRWNFHPNIRRLSNSWKDYMELGVQRRSWQESVCCHKSKHASHQRSFLIGQVPKATSIRSSCPAEIYNKRMLQTYLLNMMWTVMVYSTRKKSLQWWLRKILQIRKNSQLRMYLYQNQSRNFRRST